MYDSKNKLTVTAPKKWRDKYPHVDPKVLIRAMMDLADTVAEKKPGMLERRLATLAHKSDVLESEKDPM